jgi:hypothetical protein
MDRAEYMKKYRLDNNDKYKEYRKKWRQLNKNKLENKEKINIYSRNYYNKNKNKIEKTSENLEETS